MRKLGHVSDSGGVGCGQGQNALQDAHHDFGGRMPAVAFEVELALEGLIDRFDGLAQGLEQVRAGAFVFALAGRAQQP